MPSAVERSPRSLHILAILVLAAAVHSSTACRPSPTQAVIGIAMSSDSARDQIAVASNELASWGPGDSAIRFVQSSIALEGAGSADTAVRRANQLLATPGLAAVVGHAGSRATLFAAPLYNEAGVPHIAYDATTSLLASVGPWTFALVDDDRAQSAFVTTFLSSECNARSVSVFYVSDEYGIGLRDGIRLAADDVPLEVLDQVAFEASSDLEALVKASFSGRGTPDTVVIAGRTPEAIEILRHAFSESPSLRFVTTDGVDLNEVRRNVSPDIVDATFVVSFWHSAADNDTSRAFVERFRTITGDAPSPSNALAHDALLLLATAAREVGTSRVAIRDYLLELGSSRPPYEGITGSITFGADRPPRFVMIHAGQNRIVHKPEYVRAPAH